MCRAPSLLKTRAWRWGLRLLLQVVFLASVLAAPARADIIVLKNGRRITATTVTEENGRVSYETRAGRLTLPGSIVERIERGGPTFIDSAADQAAQLPLTLPPAEALVGYDEVARAAVHDASIDRNYIAKLEENPRGVAPPPVTRVAVTNPAPRRIQLGTA